MNLTKFTEHFNNMSYWTRTLILQQPDAKVCMVLSLSCLKQHLIQERERYVMKFIKIMKWLRKMNNFNSYLAILSALDSAPIRRLGRQKSDFVQRMKFVFRVAEKHHRWTEGILFPYRLLVIIQSLQVPHGGGIGGLIKTLLLSLT